MEFKAFDIIEVDLGEVVGSEQGKIRPCVICQNNIGNHYSPTLLVIPLTSELKKTEQVTHGVIRKNRINGLSCDSMLLCEQMRVIDKSRVLSKFGYLKFYDEKKMVSDALFASLIPRVKDEEAV